MFWVERGFKGHLLPTPPAMGRDPFLWIRLLQAPPSPALNTPQLLWQAVPVPHHPYGEQFLPYS